MRTFFAVIVPLAAALAAGCAHKQHVVDTTAGVPSQTAHVVSLPDVNGVAQRPLFVEPGQLSVIIFITTDCPISNAYSPEIQRLCMAYDPQQVHVYLVHVDRDLTGPAARKHAADFGYRCPVLLDRDHELVRELHATVTPEAFVVGPQSRVLYQGRISDLYADLGVRRPQPTREDLREAIAAALAGRAVENPRVPAIGCAIPR